MGNQTHRARLGRAGIAGIAVALVATAAHAQAGLAAGAAAARDQAMAGSGAYAIVESLTTEVGPRLAATPQMARARDWAIAKLTALGFSSVHAEAFAMPVWERGEASASVTAPVPQDLALTALGGSVATPKGGIEAEVVLFRAYADLLAAPPGALAGKIAVVTQVMARNQDGSGYGALTMMRRKGPSEAARRGAVAYLHRSLSTDDTRLPHTGQLDYAEGAPRIPAAALSTPDAELLQRLAARGPVRIRLAMTPRTLAAGQSWTVVGDIPGRTAPGEVVLLGAHLDSWDLGTGAIDDGAGVAIVTAAARIAGAQHPRRTLRVVLFGAEEPDQSGRAYAAAHKGEVAAIAIAAEADFGADRAWSLAVPQGFAAHPAVRILATTLAPIGVNLSPEPARFGGSDIAPLYQLGAPVFGIRQNGLRYFDLHHSADDTLDKIDPAALDQATAAYAAAAYVAAEAEVDFRTPAKP